MIVSPVALLTVITSIYEITDACGKRPNYQPLNVTTTTSRPDPFGNKTCSKIQRYRARCLNGGKCFWISLGGIIRAACNCPKQFIGKRCEMLFILPGSDEEMPGGGSINVPLIVGYVIAAILITVVIIVMIYCCKTSRWKNRDKSRGYVTSRSEIYGQFEETRPLNGTEGKYLNVSSPVGECTHRIYIINNSLTEQDITRDDGQLNLSRNNKTGKKEQVDSREYVWKRDSDLTKRASMALYENDL